MNLIDHLRIQYDKYIIDLEDKEDPLAVIDADTQELLLLSSFLKWAKQYLSNNNPPVSLSYAQEGLALYLRDGMIVGFLATDDNEHRGQLQRDTSVPITITNRSAAKIGMVPAQAMNITGNKS